MRKLFLTSFKFKTGENVYEEHRLVVVTKQDLQTYYDRGKQIGQAMPPRDPHEVASAKMHHWFKLNYPESECEGIRVHEAIDFVPLPESNEADNSGGSVQVLQVFQDKVINDRWCTWLATDRESQPVLAGISDDLHESANRLVQMLDKKKIKIILD